MTTNFGVLVILLIGCTIGMLAAYLTWTFFKIPDGYFFVNLTNPEDEMFKMQIDIPLEQVPDAKYLIFKVKKVQ